jgi:sugar lactone lactonase YvrE
MPVALLVLLALGTTLSAHGQSVQFMGAQRSLYATGSNIDVPYGVAVDAQGDVWTTVQGTSGVLEIQAVNGVIPASPTVVTVASSGVDAYSKGLAFDSAGDLWVADESGNSVKELVAVGGVISASPTVKTIASGLNAPFSLAFDSTGNLWVATQASGAFIQEFVAVSGVVPVNPTIRVVGSGFYDPTGVAVDASGNVYVADSQNHEVKEMVGVAPPAASTPPVTPTINVLASGFGFLNGVVVDSKGDVWAADAYQGLYEILAVDGSIPASPTIFHLPSPGSGGEDDLGMYNITLDAHGNVYYTQGDPNGPINEITPAGNFGQVPVGATSGNVALLFGFLASTNINAPAVLTQGFAGKDFSPNTAGAGTCTTNGTSHTYSAGNTCIANVLFTPKFAGLRMGAAVLSNTSAVVEATGFLEGTGTGPQIVFQGGAESTYPIPNGENYSYGVAVDAGGDIFLGDTNFGVVEIPAGCSASSCYVAMSGSNLQDPKGVAIDGSGNLYVSNGNPASVVELPLGCTSSSCAIVLGGGWQNPEDVAVDGAGNIYVADSYNNAVKEMPPGCLSTSCVTTLGGGFYVTQAVAVDGNGNVFVTDQDLMISNGGSLKEMPPGCLSSSCVNTLATGLPSVAGLAVDAAGDVYTTQEVPDAAGVYQYQAVNGSVPGSGAANVNYLSDHLNATALALDGAGNIYVTNSGLIKIDTVDAPALPFPTPTNVESQDTDDDPETDTAQNIGNVSLTFTGITPTTNFLIDVPSTDCSTSTHLVEGDTCDVGVDFAPTAAGPLSGTVTLTDNNLNATGATQPIAVSGTGVAVLGPPTAALSLSALNFGGVQIFTSSPALVETVTNTGGGSLNISSMSITQTGDTVFFLSTGANQCTNTTSLTNGQSCNVYVIFKPELSGSTSNGTLNIADNASGSPQMASLTGIGDYFYQPVGSSTSAEPVSVFITTGETLSAMNVVTAGAQTPDFTFETGGTCAIGTTYSAGQVCTVDVVFSPQYSGARNGSIYLTDASGDILGTTFLHGTGNAPQIIFGPVAPQTAIGYITGLAGVAVDAADDLFYMDGSDRLIEAPVSGPSVTVANLASLISSGTPSDVAIDPSGNLFIASNSSTPLIEVPRTGLSTWGTPVAINTGLGNVAQVAVDGLGNLYITAPALNAVYQLPLTGSGYETPVTLPFPGSGAFKPEGVAVDPSFDVYAIGQKTSNNQTEVIELPANNTGYGTPLTTAIAQLTYGGGVGTDGNGNLYVSGQTSATNGAIYFVPVSGSPVLVGTGFYFAFALDSASNIYAVQANFSDQAEIVEIPQATPPSLTFATTNVGSTSSDSPKTVTVTNVGNQQLSFYASSSYPTDFPENSGDTNLCNAEFPLNPGAECDVSVNFKPTASGPLSEDVTLNDENLNNVATQLIPVSGNGGVSVVPIAGLAPSPVTFTGQVVGTTSEAMAVTLSNTGGAALTGITPTITGTNPSDFAIGTGTNACSTTLAASSTCLIYITFTPAGTGGFTATLSVADNASGSPQTTTLNGTGVAFSSNVGTALPSQPVTVIITTAGILNSIQVFTQGYAGLDFSESTGGTCATETAYTVGQTCTVNVIFNPQVPGARPGGVLLTDALNNPLGESYLPGTATGPQIIFRPGVQSTLPSPTYASNYSAPSNIAVDASGNVYVADTLNSAVVRLPWNGTSYGTPFKLPFTNLDQPEAVAVDGVGNVFVADTMSYRILELPWSGPSGFGNQIVLDSSGLGFPDGIAVDGKGNLFFSDGELSGKVVEMAWTGNGYGMPTTLAAATGLFAPHGLAVDANDNLYIANSDDHDVVELPWNGTSFGSEIVIANEANNGLGYPESVAVDAAGDVYIADIQLNYVVEEPWNGSSFGTQIKLPITFGSAANPTGIAVAGNGNIFVSDGGDSAELELNVSTPPSLSFASTSVGATSSDSPKTVTVTNIGNAGLYFNAADNNPVYPVNFPINSSDTNLCEEDNSLYIGSSCDVSVKFNPTTTGPLSGNVVLTDNSLNVSDVTQSIPVSGTATGGTPAPTITWTPTTPITYGTTLGSGDFAATATASSTNVSADGTFSYTITSVSGTTATASTVLPGGSDTLCVLWTPSSSFTSQYGPASLCVPVQVNAASTSISWTPATPILSPATLGSGQFNASASAGSTPVSSDGTFTYYVGSVGGTVANSSTVLPIGANQQLCVQWTPSTNSSSDYSLSSTCTGITVNAPTSISWTPSSPITYGATLGSGQFNASASSGSTNIGSDGTFTYYVNSLSGAVATSSTILPVGSDQLCVQWTPLSSFTSQYSSTSLCSSITVNAGSVTINWSPSSTGIIASTGPTAGQFDATAVAGGANVTADGTMTYDLSTAGGTQINVGATLPLGPVTICAVWAPSSSYTTDYTGSSACQSFTVVNTQPTSITLAVNTNPVFSANSVTFTATVTPASGAIVPTGSVTFFAGDTSIGTGMLSPSGSGASAIAKLTTTSLAIGSQTITASYPGDANNQASSTSTTQAVVVEDFSVTADAPTSSTTEPGATATFTFTVSPVSPATTFPGAIALTATGLPTGATSSFSPPSIASGAGSTTVTLTVTTPSTTLARNQPPGRVPGPWPLAAAALLLLPLAVRFRRAGRRLSRILSLLLLFAAGILAAAALNGCGGIASGYFGQAPATSSITVTGTSGLLSHSASVSLTVE